MIGLEADARTDAREREPIVVVGAGYVGLVTAAGLAKHGHSVWCVDVDSERIEKLEAGHVPIDEPGLHDRFQAIRERLQFATDQRPAIEESGARLVVSAVGTPAHKDGSLDLSQVQCVADNLPARDNIALVMKSTVPPGTGEKIRRRLAARAHPAAYVSWPEFLQEGVALKGFDKPDRVVIGAADRDRWAADAVKALHDDWVPEGRIIVTDVTSAEAIKHCSNLALALRISFANQVANLSEAVGADALEVLKGVGRDTRIGPRFLEPGIGFGGSCFEKDVSGIRALGDEVGAPMTLAGEVLQINRAQPLRVVSKLTAHLGLLEGRRVAVLGLAFKPHTDDIRSSPAFRIIERLRDEGAIVRAWDPNLRARQKALQHAAARKAEYLANGELADTLGAALKDADAVVVATAWPEFAHIEWSAHRLQPGALVVDGRNCLDPEAVRSARYRYEGTGRHTGYAPDGS